MRETRSGLRLCLTAALFVLMTVPALAEPPAPRAARSVHLHYPAPDSNLFYNEVTVDQSQPGSYFCACGFSHGYFGIQELANGKKVVIFSVWDPPGSEGEKQDPNAVDAGRRVEVLAQGEGVRIRRFGGEGTGAQSLMDFPWKPGHTCKFVVRATTEGDKTTYTAWFLGEDPDHAEVPEKEGEQGNANPREWKHMATFRTATKGQPLRGLYSFVEDFRRDGKSVTEPRSARFGNGWAKSVAGDWVSLTRARFTGDSTPLANVDAGVSEKEAAFHLATGGDTKSTHSIGSLLERKPSGISLPELEDRRPTN